MGTIRLGAIAKSFDAPASAFRFAKRDAANRNDQIPSGPFA
jgi:hypothetical protein